VCYGISRRPLHSADGQQVKRRRFLRTATVGVADAQIGNLSAAAASAETLNSMDIASG
jgi:hypothetical protein